ncbi:MAG: hypothetical protein JWR85_287 [Marmoricola sp.]|nr:hypothetical protein [Marmoricola sp.]
MGELPDSSPGQGTTYGDPNPSAWTFVDLQMGIPLWHAPRADRHAERDHSRVVLRDDPALMGGS